MCQAVDLSMHAVSRYTLYVVRSPWQGCSICLFCIHACSCNKDVMDLSISALQVPEGALATKSTIARRRSSQVADSPNV